MSWSSAASLNKTEIGGNAKLIPQAKCASNGGLFKTNSLSTSVSGLGDLPLLMSAERPCLTTPCCPTVVQPLLCGQRDVNRSTSWGCLVLRVSLILCRGCVFLDRVSADLLRCQVLRRALRQLPDRGLPPCRRFSFCGLLIGFSCAYAAACCPMRIVASTRLSSSSLRVALVLFCVSCRCAVPASG